MLLAEQGFKKRVRVATRGVVGLWCLLAWGSVSEAMALTVQEIYSHVAPSVVLVVGHAKTGKNGSAGTGSIIHAEGLVLTNAHVVMDKTLGTPFPQLVVYRKPARVTGRPERDLVDALPARVLQFDAALDLAVLQLLEVPDGLPTLSFGNSDHVRIGQPVVAIGHPEQGGFWTLTTGVVSAELQDHTDIRGKHVFQTEVGMNRGHSGGPLVDAQGRLIGINTAIARMSSDGLAITSISFSIKANVAHSWFQRVGLEERIPVERTLSTVAEDTHSVEGPQQNKSVSLGRHRSQMSAEQQEQMPSPSQPYNLDHLVQGLGQAEADLEVLLEEMRDKVRAR